MGNSAPVDHFSLPPGSCFRPTAIRARFRGGGRSVGEIMQSARRLQARGSAGAVATAVLVAGFFLCLLLNWPGQLSFDSIVQLHDGRTGHYSAWHPPVMAWLLGIGDAIFPGTGLFILLDALLLFGSLLSLLWLSPKVSWAAGGVAFVCIALPQFLLYQGIVWKDVLFADAAIAGFVCVAHASVQWHRARARFSLLGAGFLLLVLAALARQNGAVVIVAGAVATATIAAEHSGRRRAFTYGAATLGLAFALMACAGVALATKTYGSSGVAGQFRLLQTYDIIGAAKARPDFDLGIIAHANPDLADLIRSDGVPLYTPQRNDTLAIATDLQSELNDTPPEAISAQWWNLIERSPWLYLGIRTEVFAWVFLNPDIERCVPYHVGVEGPANLVRDLKLEAGLRPQDVALGNYAGRFIHTPIYSHAAFALLAIILLAVLLRRRLAGDLAMAFMLIGAFAFVLSFFVISIACDYRYLLFLDLSALTAGFHLAVAPQNRPKKEI